MVWYPTYGPKSLFKFAEKRSVVCYYAHEFEHKMNCEGFTQNGCYGNQPQPLEVVFIGLATTFLALLQNKILLLINHSM